MRHSESARSLTLAKRHPALSPWLNSLFALAFVLLLVGVFAPLMSLEKFFIFTSRVSLASAIGDLVEEGHWGLFLILSFFSILLPLAKLAVMVRVWNGAFQTDSRMHKTLHWIALYGKWSMLDVFVIAVLLVSVKLGSIARVEVHYGLYVFAASVVLSMLATYWLIAIVQKDEGTPSGPSAAGNSARY
jgi:paraquat-inducible protein A